MGDELHRESNSIPHLPSAICHPHLPIRPPPSSYGDAFTCAKIEMSIDIPAVAAWENAPL